jgi:hypothetical protein
MTVLRACHRIWNQLPVRCIQSFTENHGDPDYRCLLNGESPELLWFSFLDGECAAHADLKHPKIENIQRGIIATLCCNARYLPFESNVCEIAELIDHPPWPKPSGMGTYLNMYEREPLYRKVLDSADEINFAYRFALAHADQAIAMRSSILADALQELALRLECSVKFTSITNQFDAMFRIEQFIADRIAGWLLFLQCEQGDDNALAKVMQSASWLQRKIAADSTSRTALNLLQSPSLHEQSRDLAANRLVAIAN